MVALYRPPVLTEWMGKDENILHAQTQLLKRAKANGLVSIGKYEKAKKVQLVLIIHLFTWTTILISQHLTFENA